jgi:predicted lipoprotein with Yx(FWY)xxD motif
MRFNYLLAAAAIGAVGLAACGGASTSAGTKQRSVVPVTINMSTAVKSGDTPLGKVLVSSSGRTLYALTNDTKTSTCTGTCAQVWPPVLVGPGWPVGSGLNRSLFSTIARTDGTRQLVAGEWPLYTFSGDTNPGDVNGQGSGGVWFAVGTNGKLVKNTPTSAASAPMSGGY